MKSISLAATAAILTPTLANIIPATYTPNTSGLVVTDVGKIVQVAGSLGVPTLNTTRLPSSPSTGQAAIGLDAQDCAGSLLAGIQWTLDPSGETTYAAFAQWGDSDTVYLDLPIGPTDYIDLEVVADGEEDSPGGSATVINASTHTYKTLNFTRQVTALCRKSASWLVIDPSQNEDGGAPYEDLADFEEVDFYNPLYYLEDDSVPYALKDDQGTIVEMERDGKVLATGGVESVPNDTNSINISYNESD